MSTREAVTCKDLDDIDRIHRGSRSSNEILDQLVSHSGKECCQQRCDGFPAQPVHVEGQGDQQRDDDGLGQKAGPTDELHKSCEQRRIDGLDGTRDLKVNRKGRRGFDEKR